MIASDCCLRMRRSFAHFWTSLTVEATIFIAVTSGALTSVVEPAYFMHKACTVDVGLPPDLCGNLTSNLSAKAEVQTTVSTFMMFNEMGYQVVPVCLSLFMGAWSDRRGRKILLLMGLAGKLWYAVWFSIGSTQASWSLYTVLFTCTLPASFTGLEMAFISSAYGYITDVSTDQDRTYRLTLMEIAFVASIPIGTCLGNYLFFALDESYTAMYVIYSAGVVAAIGYSLVRLQWATTPEQKPLNLCCWSTAKHEDHGETQPNCLADFFRLDQFKESVRVAVKRRPDHGRLYLAVLAVGLVLHSFQRDETPTTFLYTQLKFNWGVDEFSHFRIYQTTVYVFGTLLSFPLLDKWLGMSDTAMLMVACASHGAARAVFALATEPWMFYLGATLSCVGPLGGPVLRSMASKLIPVSERGKVFMLLTIADESSILLSVTVYATVYTATILTAPHTVFWVTALTQLGVFLIGLTIKLTRRDAETGTRSS